MNNKFLKRMGLGILLAVLMVVVSLVSFRTVLPVGTYTAPLAGILMVGGLLSLGIMTTGVATVIALIVMMLLGTGNWVTFFSLLILLFILVRLINWQVALKDKLAQQQMIIIGIIAGISQLILSELGGLIMGWIFNHQITTGWTFMGALLPSEILTTLLYAILVPPMIMGSRWLARQLLAK